MTTADAGVDSYWWLGYWPAGEHLYWWTTATSHRVSATELRDLLRAAVEPTTWHALAVPEDIDSEPRNDDGSTTPAVVGSGSVPLAELEPSLSLLTAALPGLTDEDRNRLAKFDARLAERFGPATTHDDQEDPVERIARVTAASSHLRRRALFVESCLNASLERAWRGPLVDPEANLSLSRALGALLLPDVLREFLSATDPEIVRRRGRTTLVIAPGPRLSAVPWDLLVTDGDQLRLIETAVIRGGISPAALASLALAPGPNNPEGPALRVLDPRSSGRPRPGRPTAALSGTADSVWRARTRDRAGDMLVDEHWPTPGCTPDAFGRILRSASWARMLYYGHVVSGEPLVPTASTLEFAAPPPEPHATADKRPGALDALTWLRTPQQWPAPRRVAFIACEADDSRYLEQLGLTLAAVNAGARLVTTTRWVLPSDQSVVLVDPQVDAAPEPHRATTDLALAVDQSHVDAHPVEQLRQWQLLMLSRWREAPDKRGQRRFAPLIWAAAVTYVIPDSAVGLTPTAAPRG